MNQLVTIPFRIEEHGPEAPAPKPRTSHRRVEYPFGVLRAGGPPAVVPRACFTVRDQMLKYLKTPEGQGKKFLVRAIGPASCRVWRVK